MSWVEGKAQATERLMANEPLLEKDIGPEELLERIDFETLNDILDTILVKSGTDTDDRPRITRERISIDMTEATDDLSVGGMATAHRDTGTLTMHWKEIEKLHRPTPQIPVGLFALLTLVHEITHLRSRYVTWPRSGFAGKGEKHGSAGFLDFVRTKGEQRVRFTTQSLDEAVTEDIASEVFAEYIRRKGYSSLWQDPQIRFMGARGYTGDRIILSAVITSLAKELKMDRDQVWRGFVREYLNGNTHTLKLMKQILESIHENKDLAAMLYESPHFDPREVQMAADEPVALNAAVYSVMRRFEPEYLNDSLGLR